MPALVPVKLEEDEGVSGQDHSQDFHIPASYRAISVFQYCDDETIVYSSTVS